MSKNVNELSLSEMSGIADYFENDYKREQKTEHVRFCNNTHDFTVEVFLYEVRQKRNLPPRSGYDEWTGVTVGATDIGRGQCRTAYLQKKVLGDFMDGGCLNIKHVPSGRITRTFNFKDRYAPEGKYFTKGYYGIIQNKSNENEANLTIEFKGVLSDGEIIEESFDEVIKLK